MTLANVNSEFFPEKAYIQRAYDISDAIPTYEAYAAGRLPSTSAPATKSRTFIPLLQRKKSRRVDLFLDWLVSAHLPTGHEGSLTRYQENATFPAIASGNLEALQVLVHADPDDRAKVIEAYTFTVQYTRSDEASRVPAGVTMGSPAGEVTSVGATNVALQTSLREIKKLCESLPYLPRKSRSSTYL